MAEDRDADLELLKAHASPSVRRRLREQAGAALEGARYQWTLVRLIAADLRARIGGPNDVEDS